jgi:uncharacterized protein
LRYKIKDIPDEGLVVDLPLPDSLLADALDGLDADASHSAGAARLELVRTHDDVLVRGRLKATLALPCASCLQPTRVDVAVPINMIYRPEEEDLVEEVGDGEDPLDDLEIGHHDGKDIVLAPMLREQVILSVPMAPHCKEGCLGLCPTCGQNRNERDCGHQPGEGATPFAALKNLKLE